MEELIKHTWTSGRTVIAGDLNWSITYDMQHKINSLLTSSDLVGAKVNADARDWKICSVLRNGWGTMKPRSSDWATRACWKICQ